MQALGEVCLPDGSVAVEAALTLVHVPERMRADGALDALGWKVIPSTATRQQAGGWPRPEVDLRSPQNETRRR